MAAIDAKGPNSAMDASSMDPDVVLVCVRGVHESASLIDTARVQAAFKLAYGGDLVCADVLLRPCAMPPRPYAFFSLQPGSVPRELLLRRRVPLRSDTVEWTVSLLECKVSVRFLSGRLSPAMVIHHAMQQHKLVLEVDSANTVLFTCKSFKDVIRACYLPVIVDVAGNGSGAPAVAVFHPFECVEHQPARRLVIFHDAENCYIPNDSNVDGFQLYTNTVKAILSECVKGNAADTDDATQIEVDYRFYLSIRPDSVYSVSRVTLESLRDCGVTHIDIGRKANAVDTKMKAQLSELYMLGARYPDLARETLVAIISGDRDFAAEVRLFRLAGFRYTVLLHSNKVRPGFGSQFGTEFHGTIKSWNTIVEKATIGVSLVNPEVPNVDTSPVVGMGNGSFDQYHDMLSDAPSTPLAPLRMGENVSEGLEASAVYRAEWATEGRSAPLGGGAASPIPPLARESVPIAPDQPRAGPPGKRVVQTFSNLTEATLAFVRQFMLNSLNAELTRDGMLVRLDEAKHEVVLYGPVEKRHNDVEVEQRARNAVYFALSHIQEERELKVAMVSRMDIMGDSVVQDIQEKYHVFAFATEPEETVESHGRVFMRQCPLSWQEADVRTYLREKHAAIATAVNLRIPPVSKPTFKTAIVTLDRNAHADLKEVIQRLVSAPIDRQRSTDIRFYPYRPPQQASRGVSVSICCDSRYQSEVGKSELKRRIAQIEALALRS